MTPRVDNIRTVPADATIRMGRLAKARQFFQTAQDVRDLAGEEQDVADSAVTLYVHAGIAAADAICAARLGKHAKGQNHQEAIALLKLADRKAANALSVLLGMKTRAGYGHDPVTAHDLARAGRAASLLLTHAEL